MYKINNSEVEIYRDFNDKEFWRQVIIMLVGELTLIVVSIIILPPIWSLIIICCSLYIIIAMLKGIIAKKGMNKFEAIIGKNKVRIYRNKIDYETSHISAEKMAIFNAIPNSEFIDIPFNKIKTIGRIYDSDILIVYNGDNNKEEEIIPEITGISNDEFINLLKKAVEDYNKI